MSMLCCNLRQLTALNKPLGMTCFPCVPSYSCLWNIQSISFCSAQGRRIQHVYMHAMRCKTGSKVKFKLNFAGVLSTDGWKEGEEEQQ